jgi:hypothetical protein
MLSTVIVLLTAAVQFTVASFETDCAAFSTRKFANTTIFQSHYVPGNSKFTVSGGNVTCGQTVGPISSPADICRITAYATTSSRSGINFEVWLPKTWNKRFMSHGNGGLSGCERLQTTTWYFPLMISRYCILRLSIYHIARLRCCKRK